MEAETLFPNRNNNNALVKWKSLINFIYIMGVIGILEVRVPVKIFGVEYHVKRRWGTVRP